MLLKKEHILAPVLFWIINFIATGVFMFIFKLKPYTSEFSLVSLLLLFLLGIFYYIYLFKRLFKSFDYSIENIILLSIFSLMISFFLDILIIGFVFKSISMFTNKFTLFSVIGYLLYFSLPLLAINNNYLYVLRENENIKLPIRKREGDAGLDLYTKENITINPGEIKIIGTGIKIQIPSGYFGLIKDRSGFAKRGLHVLAGVVDENYRGEIKIVVINLGKESINIEKNTRIAQLLIIPYYRLKVKEVKRLSETERGEKGFGSSGEK